MKILLKHKRWISRGENLANSLKKLIRLYQKQMRVVKKTRIKAIKKPRHAYKTLQG